MNYVMKNFCRYQYDLVFRLPQVCASNRLPVHFIVSHTESKIIQKVVCFQFSDFRRQCLLNENGVIKTSELLWCEELIYLHEGMRNKFSE